MAEKTFGQKLQRLEEIVIKLESPDVELEEGLKLLEEGVALHKDCQAILTKSQTKITQLLKAEDTETAKPEEVEVESDTETASLFDVADDFNSADRAKTENDNGLPF